MDLQAAFIFVHNHYLAGPPLSCLASRPCSLPAWTLAGPGGTSQCLLQATSRCWLLDSRVCPSEQLAETSPAAARLAMQRLECLQELRGAVVSAIKQAARHVVPVGSVAPVTSGWWRV
jgi:hypothetical protein